MGNAPTAAKSPEEKFVALLSGDLGLASEETDIVQALLKRGGFDVVTLAKDKVMGSRLISQDESEPYLANPTSGYRAVDQFATTEPSSWLEMFWRRTLGLVRSGKQQEAISFLQEQFRKCRPLVPVVVNIYGDTFKEPYRQAGENRSTNGSKISTLVHAYCGGWADLKTSSPSHQALLCRKCHLRLPVPTEVTTWGELRKHFAEFN